MAAGVVVTETFASPCGDILLGSNDAGLVIADWTHGHHYGDVMKRLGRYLKNPEFVPGHHPVNERAAEELAEYFGGERKDFDLPVIYYGTEFQKKVWRVLEAVPYATTTTYRELAMRLGMPQSARAVGAAVGLNPFAVIVPCHRVLGTDGSLTGYDGGFAAKKFLLAHEMPERFPLETELPL